MGTSVSFVRTKKIFEMVAMVSAIISLVFLLSILGTTTLIAEVRDMKEDKRRESTKRKKADEKKPGNKSSPQEMEFECDHFQCGYNDDDEGYLSFYSYQDFTHRLE